MAFALIGMLIGAPVFFVLFSSLHEWIESRPNLGPLVLYSIFPGLPILLALLYEGLK